MVNWEPILPYMREALYLGLRFLLWPDSVDNNTLVCVLCSTDDGDLRGHNFARHGLYEMQYRRVVLNAFV